MEASQISAVLPLKTVGRHWGHNLARADILFASLKQRAAPGLFRDIFVVVPHREVAALRAALAWWSALPIRIVDEDDILPEFRDFDRVSGWFRQQVIKLRVAELMETEFLLTLDPDMFLCKPVGYEGLIPGGRALMQIEARDSQVRWWRGAARVLGLAEDPGAPGMSVTPAILSRNVCARLFADLRARHGRSWQSALLATAAEYWTEYSLYYLTAERHGLLETFHAVPPIAGQARLRCSNNIWHRGKFPAWNAEACFGPADPGLFAVVQSNAGVKPAHIVRRLVGLVDVGRRLPDRRFIRARSIVEDLRRIAFGRV